MPGGFEQKATKRTKEWLPSSLPSVDGRVRGRVARKGGNFSPCLSPATWLPSGPSGMAVIAAGRESVPEIFELMATGFQFGYHWLAPRHRSAFR
jgi:hypothetical protein